MREALRAQAGGEGHVLRASEGLEVQAPVVGEGRALSVRLVAIAVLGAMLGAAGVVGGARPGWIDAPVARFALQHRTAALTHVLEVVTWAGAGAILIPIALATGLWLRRATGSWAPLGLLAATLAGAFLLHNAIKIVVARPRPGDGLVHAAGYSFPSGHATNAIAGWLALALVFGAVTASRRRRRALTVIALLIAAVVGVTRVYLRVHAVTDVVGGWALGGLVVLVVWTVAPRRVGGHP